MPDLIPIIDALDDVNSEPVREHGNLSDLAKGTLGTILTYENNGTDPVFIDIIRADGDTDAEFFIYIDTELKDSTRTSIASPAASFPYPNQGQKIEVGSIVEVKARHNLVPLASFKASIIGHQ
jgi:hypothetical protein